MSEQVLLKMKNIHKRFPGVYALKNVDYELRSGEVHALLGENGAGKSTLIKVLGGIYIADEGEIFIEGKKVELKGVKDAQKNGISIIHQELVLVPHMTVAENIFLGREAGSGILADRAKMTKDAQAQKNGISIIHQELVLVPHMTVAENIFLGREAGSGILADRAKMTKDAQALLDAYDMKIDARALIKDLTIAQQQMVEIVKAISYNSKILVMDEPTSSISDKEVAGLFDIMRTLTAKGVGIVYISHKMSELEEICDRVTVMRDGEYVGTRVVKETTKDDLIAMMVGRELTNYYTFDIMRTLTAKGVGIVYISHKMSELEEICDRVTVMRDGEYVGTRVVKETTKDDLIAMMVGRELTNYYTRDYGTPGEELLRCEHISDGNMVKDVSFNIHSGEIVGFAGLVGAGRSERDYGTPGEELLRCEHISDGNMVKDVSFNIHSGEIVGFAGLVGAGRSETMKAIFGLTPGYKGDIYIRGKKTEIHSPVEAMKHGIALVPEDRKKEGLYKVQSVRFNSTIEVLGQFIKGVFVDNKKEREITQKYIDMMSTKTPTQEQVIGNLSGGNQQKVIIGRWLATAPDILILDEPTRGVDVGAKSEIYAIMNELVKTGISIIMISSELPEIINMSDRIYVMAEGRIAGSISHEEVTQEAIMSLAAH